MDWLSAANHVTVAVHRRGTSGSGTTGVGAPPVLDACSVPPRLCFPGEPAGPFCATGIAIGTSLTQPICPIVASNVSNSKPKVLELNLERGFTYDVVVTNHGAAETLRATIVEN